MQVMIEKVLDTITRRNLIANGDKVIVAVSGGPDSVCLLHILCSFMEKFNIRLYAVHVNHMLRGSEADEDEAYTARICSSLGVPLHSVSRDVGSIADKTGSSLEEAGREVRYHILEEYADSIGASAIATGHNKNDQAETVLMHIIRGSGLSGLAGMGYRRGRIIRPLLDVYRSEIESYCIKHGITPRTDSTNLKSDFARNRVRLELIPAVNRDFGVNLTESLCRLSALAACDNDYLNISAEAVFKENLTETGDGFVHMKLSGLRKMHPALLGRVFRKAVSNAAGTLKGIENIHIAALADMVSKGATGPVIQLPHGIRAGVSYELLKIYIEKGNKKQISFKRHVSTPGHTDIPELGAVITAELIKRKGNRDWVTEHRGRYASGMGQAASVDKYCKIGYNSLVQYFDYDILKKGINIRNRREGDKFKPYNSIGTKKLKEYFIDNKIPRNMRDDIPLVVNDKEVIWVVGYKISDKFKVTENTKNVLRLEYKPVF